MRLILILGACCIVANGPACTIIITARAGNVFAAGNEDDDNKQHLASHYIRFAPANKEKRTLGFVAFGYKNNPFSDESAMNEAGLFYDFDALDPLDKPRKDKPTGKFNAVNEMLISCRTVAEAVKYLESVDLPQMSSAQLVIGDATGASAIVERHTTTWRAKARDYQIGTNFRTSTTPENAVTCDRYLLCNTFLAAKKRISISNIASLLKQTSTSNSQTKTWYSVICDLKKKDIYLNVQSDFAKTIRFNLATELKKGPQRLDMEDFVAKSSHFLDWSKIN